MNRDRGDNSPRRLKLRLSSIGIAILSVSIFVSAVSAGDPLYTVTDLGTLGGPVSGAVAINNNGQIVGSSNITLTGSGFPVSHAFLYENGIMTDLGALAAGASSGAQGINDSGQVVGISSTANDGPQHAFLYQNGTMTDLGTL